VPALLAGQFGDRPGALIQVPAQRGVDRHWKRPDVAVEDLTGIEGRAAVVRHNGRVDLVGLTAQGV
jgi:hypothetical protein